VQTTSESNTIGIRDGEFTVFVEHTHHLNAPELVGLSTSRDQPAQEAHLTNRIRIRALAKLAMDVLSDADRVYGASRDVQLSIVGRHRVRHTAESEIDGAGEDAEVFGGLWKERTVSECVCPW
jgi:hypothetical protein